MDCDHHDALWVRPGEITFNVILVDNFGARTIHTESPNGELSFVILNEPPSMTPISLSKYEEKSTNFIMTESIILSANESPAVHIIEVGVDDPDGVSVVQAKIGRLAPIGSSEKWLSLMTMERMVIGMPETEYTP